MYIYIYLSIYIYIILHYTSDCCQMAAAVIDCCYIDVCDCWCA